MANAGKRSRIPVGTQFSPDLVDLRAFLRAAIAHSGDLPALSKAAIAAPVRTKPYGKSPTRRMLGLPLEAAVQYSLLTERSYEATDLTRALLALPDDQVYKEFARHILLKLGGLRVVQATEEMLLDGIPITGDTLARYLTDQGFFVAEHNTAINTLRMWLAKAGLFPAKGRGKAVWRPNPAVKAELVVTSRQVVYEGPGSSTSNYLPPGGRQGVALPSRRLRPQPPASSRASASAIPSIGG